MMGGICDNFRLPKVHNVCSCTYEKDQFMTVMTLISSLLINFWVFWVIVIQPSGQNWGFLWVPIKYKILHNSISRTLYSHSSLYLFFLPVMLLWCVSNMKKFRYTSYRETLFFSTPLPISTSPIIGYWSICI